MFTRKIIKCFAFFALGLFFVFLVAMLIPQKIQIATEDGGSVFINSGSMLGKIRRANCLIDFKSGTGKSARIELLQDAFDGPMMVIPTTNKDVFLCIYDYDVKIDLLKVDLSRSDQTGLRNDEVKIVRSSTCKCDWVSEIDTSDWAFAASAIRKISPSQFRRQIVGLDLGLFRVHTSQTLLLNWLLNYGEQGGRS